MPLSTLFEQAQEFLQLYHSESNLGGLEKRLDQVQVEILQTGTYRLTEKELSYGAKLAWRNSNRCMGRLFWKTLKVRDRRTLRSAEEVFLDALAHLKSATQGGKIRSTLSVYATADEGDSGFRILNKQLVRFAGYTLPNGEILGDPDAVAFTSYCMSLGWEGKNTAFDLLPLVIQRQGEPASWFALPEEKVLRVALSHPDYTWFKELGLQWYAVPVISDMRLEIGGISFPCALRRCTTVQPAAGACKKIKPRYPSSQDTLERQSLAGASRSCPSFVSIAGSDLSRSSYRIRAIFGIL